MDRRRFLAATAAAIAAPVSAAAQSGFDGWVEAAEADALRAGVGRSAVEQARTGLTFNASLIRPAGAQPESRRVGRYVQSLITGDGPIARSKLSANPGIQEVQQRFGVPASVLVAFWGRETGYGRDMGNLDVFSTFATLGSAAQGRTDWKAEYIAALKILETGIRQRPALRGSMAGALGHTQLMPTSYLRYGEDFDRDGKIDVWQASPLDAMASAARHIQDAPKDGPPIPAGGKAWRSGASWIAPVRLPAGFDLASIEVEETSKTPQAWADLGVRLVPGSGWRDGDAELEAKLALPAGVRGPALLLLPNFDVFEHYNPSRTYALGVGLLARHIDGAAPVDWPEEEPLSLEDRQSAQRALAALGHYQGAIDGDLGRGSRKAIRAWQRKVGRAPDGYLTSEMVSALKGG